MEKENKVAVTSFRIEPALKKQMGQACVDHQGLSQQQIVNEGIRLWLQQYSGGKTQAQPPAIKRPDHRWHALLDVILARADRKVCVLIKTALEVHGERLMKGE